MKVITVGRDSSSDKVIDDPYASQHHLQIIEHDDGHFSLADFGSTNGTYVNGQKVRGEVPLNDMDIVRIGNTTIPWRMYFEDNDVIEAQQKDVLRNQNEKDLDVVKPHRENVKMKLKEMTDFSIDEISQLVSEGARFVRFSYVISIVVMTFKRESGVYFLSKDVSARAVGWPYTLITILLGWWGIPYGLIYTIKTLVEGVGGRDVTEEVMATLNNRK